MAWVHPNELHILNALQSRPRKLPSELLSIIFQHACPTSDIINAECIPMPTPFHLVLRLVSTLWYDVSQSTPQLWTSIFLPKLYVEDIDTRAQYLKLCLNNSGDLPLTLSLRFDPRLREAGYFISPIVDTALEHSAHRIRALRLLQPPRGWLENLIPRMCQLAAMHILNHKLSPNHALEEHFFRPKTVDIHQIVMFCPSLGDFRLECSMASVTHVDLYECPIDFIVELLLRCPNLIDFHCQSPAPPSKVKDPRMLTSPLVRNHLSTFTWSTHLLSTGMEEWFNVLYEQIHFPALTRFNWMGVSMGNTMPRFPLFKFPKSVTTLELDALHFDFIEGTFNHFLPLTDITQLRYSIRDYSIAERTFSTLSWETDQSTNLFPKLTSITIDYKATERRKPPKGGEKLVQMLRSRIGMVDQFTLTVEGARMTLRWNDETRHALRELKRDGLDLTIIERGRPIMI